MNTKTIKWPLLTLALSIFSASLLIGQNTDGDALYDNSFVHTLDIVSNYPASLIDSLDDRHLNEVANELEWSYMQVNASFDGNFVDSIGMRIKGGDISYSTVKPSIKLDLNEFVSGKKYDGLKKINIDNCLHDPSLMREKLYYDLAINLGSKASRTSFVKVTIDGVAYGTYVYIEQVNKQFLERNYGNKDGNLFKARGGGGLELFGNNTVADYPWQYELKTNETANDWSDLLLLIDRANNTPANDFKDTISKYLNVDAVLNYMALGTYTVYLDNLFSGGNNGYWYHNTATDKFEIIPWDIDFSFQGSTLLGYPYTPSNTELVNPIMNRGVFEKILNVPDFYNAFIDKCCFIHAHLGHKDSMKTQIDDYKATLTTASVTPDPNCDYTNFSDPNNPFIQDYTFWGLKEFADLRHAKFDAEFNLPGRSCILATDLIEGFGDESIKVFPNPVSNILKVDLPNNSVDQYEILILNMFGQLVYQSNKQTEIDVHHLPNGVYIVAVKNGQQEYRKKIIKE